MRNSKRILSILVALFMVISMASPMVALAEEEVEVGSLTIHKLFFEEGAGGDGEVGPPAGTQPLEGAEFTIWPVADDAEMPYAPSGPGTSITTDSNGEAVFSNLVYGRYYVEETGIPHGVTQESQPFMVDIPGTSEDGVELIDDVHVYPKNELTLGAARIHKMDEMEEALEGAKFSLYKKVEGGEDELIASDLETGANGWTPIQGDLEVGDYYFIETEAPDGYLLDETKVEFTIGAGDHAYLNGEIVEGKVKEARLYNFEKPGEPVKEVDKDNAGIGDKVTWTIKTQLPGNIQTYTEYRISDKLDQALNYDNNLVVTLDGNALDEGVHYNLLSEPDGTGGGLLNIDFVPAGLSGGKLIILFDTIINEKAIAGKDIDNQAILEYNNGFEGHKVESNVPEVKVGGHKFKKIDAGSEEGLKGAEFIVRNEDGKYLIKDQNGMISWGDKEDAYKFISNSDGQFEVNGLAFGTYFLEETKAPEGYNKLQGDMEFKVEENSHEAELAIINRVKPDMPQTGGMGTILFTVVGLGLMGVAAKTYKKEE